MPNAPGLAAERALDVLARVQQLVGFKSRPDAKAGVVEVALIEHQPDGLGLVHRRGCEHLDAAARQLPGRALEHRPPVADVGTQTEVADARRGGRHSASRHTSTDTSVTTKASGGSGFAALTHTACTLYCSISRSAIAAHSRSSVL